MRRLFRVVTWPLVLALEIITVAFLLGLVFVGAFCLIVTYLVSDRPLFGRASQGRGEREPSAAPLRHGKARDARAGMN